MAFSSRTKHIKVKESFLVAVDEDKQIYLWKVHTKDNATDIFTKTLPVGKFEHCSNLIHMEKCWVSLGGTVEG